MRTLGHKSILWVGFQDGSPTYYGGCYARMMWRFYHQGVAFIAYRQCDSFGENWKDNPVYVIAEVMVKYHNRAKTRVRPGLHHHLNFKSWRK